MDCTDVLPSQADLFKIVYTACWVLGATYTQAMQVLALEGVDASTFWGLHRSVTLSFVLN